jgi:hypothetical protein
MMDTAKPLSVELKYKGTEDNHVLVNNDLKISFRRTIRVPDNNQASKLPPDLGVFPLSPISEHVNKMTPEMAAKGGLFFPMYREYGTLPSAIVSHLIYRQNPKLCGSGSTVSSTKTT